MEWWSNFAVSAQFEMLTHPGQWNSEGQIYGLREPIHESWFDLCPEITPQQTKENTMTTEPVRFKVIPVHQEQFEVWDMATPDIIACYDNEPMAQDHAKRALKSYRKS